jgi:hypothetical protein
MGYLMTTLSLFFFILLHAHETAEATGTSIASVDVGGIF